MGYRVAVIVERHASGYVAYCDELRAMGTGDTEAQALENLRKAIHGLFEDFGPEIRARLEGKTAHLLDVE